MKSVKVRIAASMALVLLTVLSFVVGQARAAVPSTTASGLVTIMSSQTRGAVNDFLAMFKAIVPELILVVVALVVLGFAVTLFKKWTRGRQVHAGS